MSSFLSRYAWYAVLVLCLVVYLQHRRTVRLTVERDRYQQNSNALLSEVRRYRIDSTTTAVDVQALRLTIDEYKRFREDDFAKIKAMGIKIRNLQAAAKHQIAVNVPVNAQVQDTLIIRDTLPVIAQTVRMHTPHISIDGIIDNNQLVGRIHIPVVLQQAIWVEYKRRWLFWKRVKAVHQTITSDNPYVIVGYSEYIQIAR